MKMEKKGKIRVESDEGSGGRAGNNMDKMRQDE